MKAKYIVNLNTFEIEENTSPGHDEMSTDLILNGVNIIPEASRRHDTGLLAYQIKGQIEKKNRVAIKRGLMFLYLIVHENGKGNGYFYTHSSVGTTPSSAKMYLSSLKCTIRATGKGLKIVAAGHDNKEYWTIEELKVAFKKDIKNIEIFENTFKSIESKVDSIMKNFKK